MSGYGGGTGKLFISNNIFSKTGVSLGYIDGPSNISNNIFLDNAQDIQVEDTDARVYLRNNFLNEETLPTMTKFSSGNIFTDTALGFYDEDNDDFSLTSSSGLIDKGSADQEYVYLPQFDFGGEARQVGTTVDIGPFEYSDTDSDGLSNHKDNDDDGDGVVDSADAFPLDPSETIDTDLDGVGNNTDSDDDDDGVADTGDAFPLDSTESIDTDLDGIGNNADSDDDGDGVSDSADAFPTDASETLDTDSDGIGNNADTDDDGDGLSDSDETTVGTMALVADTDGDGSNDGSDAFPLDSTETLDTDSDGIGNNADTDDDGDGVSDEQEAIDGTDPLSASSCSVGCDKFDLDIDNDGATEALTDGLLIIRHLFGFSGDALISGAVGTNAERASADAISTHLTTYKEKLDVDGDENTDALTDGLLIIRELFGFSGDSLIAGAVATSATRSTSSDVIDYLKTIKDTDNDTYFDDVDVFPTASDEWLDTDGDGTGDNADTDDDGDGFADNVDGAPLDATKSFSGKQLAKISNSTGTVINGILYANSQIQLSLVNQSAYQVDLLSFITYNPDGTINASTSDQSLLGSDGFLDVGEQVDIVLTIGAFGANIPLTSAYEYTNPETSDTERVCETFYSSSAPSPYTNLQDTDCDGFVIDSFPDDPTKQ